ncbi:hypothetical protein EBU99_02000 [bacterium]|nr:hypothetical protein [bacterium]
MPIPSDYPMPIVKNIATAQQHGANSPTPLEWWYLTGHLWSQQDQHSCKEMSDVRERFSTQPHYAIQSTFFFANDSRKTSTALRGLLAHAAEAQIEKKQHQSSERAVALNESTSTHPLATVTEKSLNLALGNWRLTQLGISQDQLRWDLRFDIKGTEYLLQLDIPKDKIWLHGNNGLIQKTADTSNFYYTFPFVFARGLRISTTSDGKQTSETVCGQLWFDHEIHVKKVMDVGWRWFGLSFSNEKALMIYQISKSGSFADARGEIWDQKTGTKNTLEQVKVFPRSPACLAQSRCYPQEFVLQFKNPTSQRLEQVTTNAWFADQEMSSASGGLGRVYWEGGTKARWSEMQTTAKKTSQPVEGFGFTELVP